MSTERTIDIEIRTGLFRSTTGHFNVDNVAYFQAVDCDLTEFGWALVGGSSLLAVLVIALVWSLPILGVVVGGLVFGGLWWYLHTDDGANIGTLTGTVRLQTKDLTALEGAFENRSHELITLTGRISGLATVREYRHHLVPDNIVSLQHRRASLGVWRYASAVGVVFLLGKVLNGLVYSLLVGSRFIPNIHQFEWELYRILVAGIVVGACAFALRILDAKGTNGQPLHVKVGACAGVVLVVLVFDLLFGVFPSMGTILFGAPQLWPSLPAILIKSVTLAVAIVALLPSPDRSVLHVQLQGGETQSLVMDDKAVEAVVDQFRER